MFRKIKKQYFYNKTIKLYFLLFRNFSIFKYFLFNYINRKIIIFIMLLVTFNFHSYSADFEKGMKAYENEDYEKALNEWLLLGKSGHVKAQLNIGIMYEFGKGVSKNYFEAIKWYELAAKQGNVKAQSYLGFIYVDGIKVSQNYKKSAKWFRLAANQGDAKAQTYLGILYDNGYGLKKDVILANMWLNIAAINGEKSAKEYLEIHRLTLSKSELNKSQNLLNNCKNKQYRDC